jgi:hypothetical protein
MQVALQGAPLVGGGGIVGALLLHLLKAASGPPTDAFEAIRPRSHSEFVSTDEEEEEDFRIVISVPRDKRFCSGLISGFFGSLLVGLLRRCQVAYTRLERFAADAARGQEARRPPTLPQY